MAEICPTILAETPAEFARQSDMLAFARRLQIDITDGEFAPSKTVNLNQVYWGKDQLVDLHLMLQKPVEWTHMLVSLAPHLVIVHAEAEGDLSALFDHLKQFKIKVGVAILPQTNVSSTRELLEKVDHVLIFGGNLGFQGGQADLTNLEKVAEIRAIKSDVEIGWDGGANAENVKQIADAGVNVINVGSAIAKANDPHAQCERLMEIAQ